jgi:hypothetical protein
MRGMRHTLWLGVALVWLAGGTAALGGVRGPAAGTEPTAAQAARTLVCRMGGEMRWSLAAQFDVIQTQLDGKSVRVPVVKALLDQLMFGRATFVVKPDASNLAPGQCGFTDRAMTAADPDTVVADDDDFLLRQNVLWGNGSTLRSEATVFGGSLSFQNKQAFTMQVTTVGNRLKVVAGTKPKALKW